MHARIDTASLEKLKIRLRGLRAKTLENGCTEPEAILAAAKVADLLDRYALSLTDIEIRSTPCERKVFATSRKKRMPLDECIGAIAHFCDCRVWREKRSGSETRYVFFGLGPDTEVAHYLAELVDEAIRFELGRYKTSVDYGRFRHQDRHLANASFALGMVGSIAEKLMMMKADRDAATRGNGRDLVITKAAVVDTELARLGLVTRETSSAPRMVAPAAYEAGEIAGATMPIDTRPAKR